MSICVPARHTIISISDTLHRHLPHQPAETVAHGGVKPVLRKYTFELTLGQTNPDGFERPAILINGAFPGPTLYANVLDPIEVHVVNKLEEPATIHWHGFLQRGTNSEDGVPTVTQDAILPGGTRTYRFVADGEGTYW